MRYIIISLSFLAISCSSLNFTKTDPADKPDDATAATSPPPSKHATPIYSGASPGQADILNKYLREGYSFYSFTCCLSGYKAPAK